MHEQAELILYEGLVVAESPLLKRERGNRYGTVPGLDDSELADPDELERQVFKQEFGPVLTLATKPGSICIKPNVDESRSLDWGAFGTVDFSRTMPDFNKARYKADKVAEQLKDVVIIYGIVNERVKAQAKYLVLKYLRMGIIELQHIVDDHMAALARLYLRARRMRREIAELRKASWQRQQRQTERFLETL